MMFWLLALVLLASLAGVGYRQGAIRVAFSLVGILVGALLAGPLGKLVKALLVTLGLKTPPLAWLLAPLVVFVLISVIFKVAALMVHQKVDVHFKYHAGDLRLALWERLSRRLGLCLGLVNGALYLILLSFVIYPLSYWTVQMATEDKDPKTVRVLNRLGQDLQSTGFAKVARAVDPMPQVWYDSADLAGLIYNNPLSEARLARYPAFLGLAERPEFQDMANDTQFTEMLLRQEPIMSVLDHPKAQAIIQNPDLLQLLWATVVPDLKDLPNFLATGKSAKVRLGEDSRPLELQRERRHGPVPPGQAEYLVHGNAEVEEMDGGGFRQDQLCGDDRSPGHSQERAPTEAARRRRRANRRDRKP